MSDLAWVRGGWLPVPGRSVWWLTGAIAAGILVPAMIGAVTGWINYLPTGGALFGFAALGIPGTALLCASLAFACAVIGTTYAVAAWSWRPIILAAALCATMIPGCFGALVAHLAVREWGFSSFAARSAPLVAAIKAFERDHAMPPRDLTDLVPRYLPVYPRSDVVAFSNYQYQRGSGPCQGAEGWSLAVDVDGPFKWQTLMYCPSQIYPGNPVSVTNGWAFTSDVGY